MARAARVGRDDRSANVYASAGSAVGAGPAKDAGPRGGSRGTRCAGLRVRAPWLLALLAVGVLTAACNRMNLAWPPVLGGEASEKNTEARSTGGAAHSRSAGARGSATKGSSTSGNSGASGVTLPTVASASKELSELPSTPVQGVFGEPEVRVRLLEAATVANISTNTLAQVFVMPADATVPTATLRAPLSVALDAEGWTVRDASGVTAKYVRSAELLIAPDEAMLPASPLLAVPSPVGGRLARAAASAGLAPKLTLDSGRFSGTFLLLARSDASPRAFDLIESVAIEEYLRGVVTAEMFASWPRGAFQAQAVVARSYAIHQRQLARAQGAKFDLESNVRDQAYKGVTDNTTAALAVLDTRGAVLAWNGSVLRAYYSSTTGGRAASARDTWPIIKGFEYNLAGPLQTGPRDATLGRTSPWFRWQVTRTRADLSARLRAWGQAAGHPVKHLREVVGVRLATSNDQGRPSRFVLTDSTGATYTLQAEQLRFACNAEAPGLAAITRETRVHSSDVQWAIDGAGVTITGRGFGHGVGMCQYSAKELADRGEKWREIVTTFYPGAQLVRAY